MFIHKPYVFLLVLGLSSLGCEKKDAAPTEQKAEAPAESAAKPALVPDQQLDQEIEALAAVIDMPEDYITVAEEQIKDDNLTAELERLEKELAEEEAANPVPAAKPAAKPAPTGK